MHLIKLRGLVFTDDSLILRKWDCKSHMSQNDSWHLGLEKTRTVETVPIVLGQYKLGKTLGIGAFSEVKCR